MTDPQSDSGEKRARLLAKLTDLYLARELALQDDRPAMVHACELAIHMEESILRQLGPVPRLMPPSTEPSA